MKKIVAITGGIIVGLGILAAVLLVAAKLLITPERVKKTVLPLAEKSLNRRVTLGDIHIRLFSGISIENLQVKMREGEQDLVAAESLVLRYRLWPLLKKRVIIDEVRVEKPQVRIIREPDGTFNFSDLLEQGRPVSAGDKAPPPETGGGMGIDLLVSRVRISDGEIRFTDRSVGPEPFSYPVSRFHLSAQNISLQGAFPVDIRARLDEASLGVTASVDPAKGDIEADIRLDGFHPVDFSPYFRTALPGRVTGAALDMKTSLRRHGKKLDASGRVEIRDLSLVLDALPEAPVQNARLRLDYDLAADTAAQALEVGKAELDANGVLVSASGKITSPASGPGIDIRLNLPRTGVNKIIAAVPPGLVRAVKDMKPAGFVEAGLHLAGPVEKPLQLLKSGKVQLEGVQAAAGGIRPVVTGTVDISGNRLSAKDLKIAVGKDVLFADLEVTDFFSQPVHVIHRVEADSLDLDALAAATREGRTSPAEPKETKSAAKKPQGGTGGKQAPAQPFPMELPLHVDGRLEAAEARYRNLPVTDLKVHYTLIDNLFKLQTLEGRVAQGTISADAQMIIDRKKPDFDIRLDVREAGISPVLSAFYPPLSGVVAGGTSLEGRFSGKGIALADIRRHLSGKSRFAITGGRIAGNELVKGLAGTLGLENRDYLEFDKFAGTLRIVSGKVEIAADYESRQIKMHPSGTVGLDGSMNISLDLSLAPGVFRGLAADSPLTRFLADSQGWTQVPLALSGTVFRPRFKLDQSQLRRQVREKAAEKLVDDALKKLFSQ